MTAWIKRRQRARLRRVMRGYRFLKRADQLASISQLKSILIEKVVEPNQYKFSRNFFGAAFDAAEISVRQYLLVRVGALTFNQALLKSIADNVAVVHPLPKQWRQVLQQQGYAVAPVKSALLWHGYLLLLWLYGIGLIGQQLLRGCAAVAVNAMGSLRNTSSPHSTSSPRRRGSSKLNSLDPRLRGDDAFAFNQSLSKYSAAEKFAYFHGLRATCLPQRNADVSSHDIVTWYLNWPGKPQEIKQVFHQVKHPLPESKANPQIRFAPPVLPLDSFGLLLKYAAWGFVAAILALFDLARGRWWHALMLAEASNAAVARLQKKSHVAQDVFYSNTSWTFRPLWTYEAENKGAQISLYFYSTNVEEFKLSSGYPPVVAGWQIATWPRYIVWDNYQADFVQRAIPFQREVTAVGSIWYESSAETVELPAGFKVAVFDVTPHRHSRYCSLGITMEYYVPAVCNAFLADIVSAVETNEANMVWKRKRKIGKLAHVQYRTLANQLTEHASVIAVDESLSAWRVIEACDAVVSIPFTSTALIARELGKPVVYYDPLGWIQPDDRAAHGINIIVGKEALSQWLTTQMSSNHSHIKKSS